MNSPESSTDVKAIWAPLITSLEELQECHLLWDTYISTTCYKLKIIAKSLQSSNENIKKSIASKKNARALIKEEAASSKKRSQRKKKPANSAPQVKVEPPKVQQTSSAVIEVASTNPPAKAPIDPIQYLEQLLHGLYQESHSAALRQAIWHFDALMTVQNAYREDHLLPADHLNYLDFSISSAHKLLEQTYRFCLERKGTFKQIHNLKFASRLLNNSDDYPDIIAVLYQANEWTRYFHIYKNALQSFTTQKANIPVTLLALVEADEKNVSRANVHTRVKVITEESISHAIALLERFASSEKEFLPAPVKEIRIEKPIDIKKFQGLRSALQSFLTQSKLSVHHPVYLQVKQASSALKMFISSVQQLNKATTTRDLATWTAWSLQQLQEATEDLLHGIEFFQKGNVSVEHELKDLSTSAKLNMGPLAEAMEHLSFKPRYPVDHNHIDGEAAKIIDDVEALKQHPGLLEGWTLSGHSPLLWNAPSENLSVESIVERLTKLFDVSAEFLTKSALPTLKLAHKKS